MANKKNGEVYPLLTTDWLGTPTYRQRPVGTNIRYDEEEPRPQFEDDEEVFDIIDQKKKRSVNLVWVDVFLLALDFLQILALIQSMSLRWVYPEKWLRNTYFIFGFNADVWEIKKFTDSSVYKSVQKYFISSDTVGVSFETICTIWFIVPVGLGLIYGLVHLLMWAKFYPALWARRFMSRLQFVCVTLIHILSLPFGVVLFRIFQCEGDWNKVDTINAYDCMSTSHWKLGAPAVIYIILLFLVYPAFLVRKIHMECMSGTSKGYLSFLLMKETEYKIHLNWSWLFDGMWTFSSFKYRGKYYRVMVQGLKLLLLIVYVSGFNHISQQSMFTAIILLLAFVLFLFIRPFRLTSCNAFLVFSLLCNLGNAFIGSLISAYDSYTIPSAWLTADYVIWFIVLVQASWLLSFVCLLVYLISRTLCHSTKCCYKRPVWPNIASSGRDYLTEETRKFMVAIIKAKIAHEKIIRVPAMFAPVHELGRHIQIINTYWREAEYINDPMHMVLWEVMDTLVETHAELSPRSLFADSVKKSIRKTAADFMSMVPMFSQRLAQRDYEMILVPPHKKRLLLKMYILGIFLNGRADKVAKRKLMEPKVEKMWPSLPADREFEEEDGYYEDLYPGPISENYTDDLLGVIVENSTDAESTEEEDNIQGMLKNLPDVGLIDLEEATIPEENGTKEEKDDDQISFKGHLETREKDKFGMMTVFDRRSPRPASSSSSSSSGMSSRSSSASAHRPGSEASSLFKSQTSLRNDMGSSGSLQPPRPASAKSGRSLTPEAPPSSPSRRLPASAGSSHSGRGKSPTGRPQSGSSVISSLPSRPGSSASVLSERLMATINPGYIPDTETGGDEEHIQGEVNEGYAPDPEDHSDVEGSVAMTTTGSEFSRSDTDKKRRKKKKKNKH